MVGVARTVMRDELDTVFRHLAREHHPDIGGSHAMMRITAARDAAYRAVSAATASAG